MAKVKVRGFTVIRDVFGASEVEVDVAPPETVEGVLDTLLERYDGALKRTICDPSSGEMAPFLIRLNEEIISSTLDKDRPVESGDEMTIIFPVGGGR
ncbi:MAG: MoaD/ThiS family protein [Chloroflexota bacterium]